MKHSTYKHGFALRRNQNYFYKMWGWIKSRCYNPNDTCYKNYGDRGIGMCDEWKDNPVAFIEWCKNNWDKGLVIDRINNNGDYSPSNCHFVTRSESCINQRKRKDNTSGYRGISYHKGKNCWIARIQKNNRRIELCWTHTSMEAAIIRDNYIMENNLSHPLSFQKLDGGP